MKTRHLLTVADLEPEELWALIDLAARLKSHPGRYLRALYEKTLLMLFETPSLRTRLSFETAMTQLHGHAISYYTVHSPWALGKESIEDVARTIGRYSDGVTARLYSHEDLVKLARSSPVPVINAMTNEDHPCQALGDFMTIREKLGQYRGLRLAYCGDARNNVTYSLMRAAAMTGNRLAVACPRRKEYSPEARVLAEVSRLARRHGGKVAVMNDAESAVKGAAVVYTDSWMSYRIPAEEKPRRARDLRPFQVNRRLLAAAGKEAIFMHCLPAWRGDEVTASVIDGRRSVVFDQAENRLHVQKAVLLEMLGEAKRLA